MLLVDGLKQDMNFDIMVQDRCLLCLILLALIQCNALATDCNASQMSFTSRFSLGKQDEFNRTFAKIQNKIGPIQSVVHTTSGAVYEIFDIKPVFYYRYSTQKATFRGKDTIVINGGVAEVQLNFSWSKTVFVVINGTGTVSGVSGELLLAKQLVVDKDSYSYNLLDAMPFKMPEGAPFSWTRIDPPSLSQTDKQILLMMVNNMTGDKDLKNELENEIAKIYNAQIADSLHDEHFPINSTFNYTWVPGSQRPNVTVVFTRRPISVDVEIIGLISTFDIQIQNDSSWTCGTRKVPDIPLDPKTYGGIQEYLSYDFYESVLKWAAKKSILNGILDKANWGNRMFQFYAGDLYGVLSDIQSKYYANEKMKGECKANPTTIQVFKNNNSSFNVSLRFDCDLYIKDEKIIDFTLNLIVAVGGNPNKQTLDFRFISHWQNITYSPTGTYKLINRPLADSLIADCLNRLYQGLPFGSGWPQSPPRDYPIFRIEDNFTVVLDSSAIPDSLVLQE